MVHVERVRVSGLGYLGPWRTGFRVPRFGFRVSGFGVRVSEFGFHVSLTMGDSFLGFGSQVLGFEFRVSQTGEDSFPASKIRVSGFGFRVSEFGCQVSRTVEDSARHAEDLLHTQRIVLPVDVLYRVLSTTISFFSAHIILFILLLKGHNIVNTLMN